MPDQLVLAFDTSAAHCAAALLMGDRVLTTRLEEMAKGQAERLFPMLEEVLNEAGKSWSDLSLIGVGTGPGNFTGIRVAVAAARGLSLSLKIPAIGVGVTEASALGLPRPCRIVIPSRRDQVIWQDFPIAAEAGSATVPQQGTLETLPDGPAAAAPVYPLAEAIARIALARAGTEQPRPAPSYLRPADAAPSRDPAPVILP